MGRQGGVIKAVHSSLFLSIAVVIALGVIPSAAIALDEPAAGLPGKAQTHTSSSPGVEAFSKHPSHTLPYSACPAPTATRVACQAIVVPPGAAAAVRQNRKALNLTGRNGATFALEGSGVEGGFSPTDLRAAYNVPYAGGKGTTIAIVDAHDSPNAESSLKTYRAQYGLPPCTTANGCFSKVNQDGEKGNYPAPPNLEESGWKLEIALDLDMASAICPECNLLLVEADSAFLNDLGAAVNTAAGLGATVISNSWGAWEHPGEIEEDSLYFNHPGIPIFASSGDSGYGTSYPSASPNVISVGGTSLSKNQSARTWRESAWSGAGSGCSEYEKKPEWQNDKGCANRMSADVSAVADPNTPVSVYAEEWEEQGSKSPGWLLLGGTSASAPVLAGIVTRATAADRAKGARLFWEQGPEGKLFDIAEGHNGHCYPQLEYVCGSKAGYDGPTGWGTPGASRPGPPGVGTYDPTEVTLTKATLNGVVNPNGKYTNYHFEYGTTTSYGTTIPPSGEVFAGKGTTPLEVSTKLEGLTPGTTYHYRLVAHTKESTDTTYGGDHTFVTSRWSVQHMPTETVLDELRDVSCASSTDCIAVGEQGVQYELVEGEQVFFPSVAAPIAEHWNGNEWSRKALPLPYELPGGEAHLQDVSCGTPTACMAVGDYRESGPSAKSPDQLALIERWDGTKWSLSPAAIPADAAHNHNNGFEIHLQGVSCVSATSCTAVGHYLSGYDKGNTAMEKTLVEVWNGSQWQVQTSPNPSGENQNKLNSVSCTAPGSCMAVGWWKANQTPGPRGRTLILKETGGVWTLVSTENIPGQYLESVSCSTASSCMAVGSNYEFLVEKEPEEIGLAEYWNGTAWSTELPSLPLTDVSCLATNWCFAMSTVGDVNSTQAVGERWNGTGWTAENALLPYDATGKAFSLPAVSCQSSGCTAVGRYLSPGRQLLGERLRLVENLTPPVISPSSPYQAVTESTTNGTWSGEPVGYEYQWKRCNASGSECVDIAGAAASTYVPVEADVGHTLRVKVTAKGPGGGAAAEAPLSGATGKVQAMGQVTEYALPAGSEPFGIASGPDGRMWFTSYSKIGKVTNAGSITEYAMPAGVHPNGIVAGPDGKLWYTVEMQAGGGGKIGAITTLGGRTEYALPSGSNPSGITVGPDGNLWFTDIFRSKIGKITTSGVITEYSLPSGSSPYEITKGPDGKLWFTDASRNKVGKITTSGAVTEYSLPAGGTPLGIATGSDGNLWFACNGSSKIGKITTAGTITEYKLPAGSAPWGIAPGAGTDYGLWFANRGTSKVGRITTAGAIAEFSLPVGSEPHRLAAGSDGKVWFTAMGTSKIGNVTP